MNTPFYIGFFPSHDLPSDETLANCSAKYLLVFQSATVNTGPIFHRDRHEARGAIRGRPIRIVFLQPVMEFAVGDVLLFTKLLLRLSASFPDLNQGKHQLLRGRDGRFHSFFLKTMVADYGWKYVLYRRLTVKARLS